MVLDSGSEMGVPRGLPPGNFQSSLRDFSSLESLPRTASWAKFSRPCGTRLGGGRSHADTEALIDLNPCGTAEACPSFRLAPGLLEEVGDGENQSPLFHR